MTFSLYDASSPLFMRTLTNMQAWLDKAAAQGADEAVLMAAKLADDMRPFPFQYQSASDTAKSAVARLTGADYLTGFVLPNFFFHVTTAYALLRANGVPVGKPDFLQHLGPPNLAG